MSPKDATYLESVVESTSPAETEARTIRLDQVIDLTESHISPRRIPITKRALDVVMASLGLLLSAPLWLVLAIAIKLDDGGPVLYKQTRWGRGGEIFSLLKFRTMVADSDSRFGIKVASHDDDRVTRLGRVLRATGMDELPQFLSILRGDMSFVGPRALAVGEIVGDAHDTQLLYESIPGFTRRLEVQPGLTGLATIHLPKDASPLRKLEFDLRYIEEWSFWGDMKLIILSFWISFRGKWETRQKKY